jgi:ankyrin repeat protein
MKEDYTGYIFTDNELDNVLFHEFLKDNPSEQYVRELIAKGANINAINKIGNSVLTNTIFLNGQETNLQTIQLLIDLGANLNYEEDGEGFNCLFNAALTCNPELVELLLKAGANPNCISVEDGESLLDWAYFEWGLAESDYGDEAANQMEIIVRLLEKYGAKFSRDLYADKPEKQLKMFASYDTGLFTAKGNLRIEQIPNADEILITQFNEWLKTNLDDWQEYRKNKYLPKPEILEQHNQQGLSLAKRIKDLVGNDIVVTFLSVSSDDIRNKHVRNVTHTVIEL